MARKPQQPITAPAAKASAPAIVPPAAASAEAVHVQPKSPLLASSSLTAPAAAEAALEHAFETVQPAIDAAAQPIPAVVETMEAATSPATASDVNPAAAPAAQETQGPADMATMLPPNAADAADKTQAMLGDVQTRMKTAFDRSSKMGEEMVELSKGNVEAMMASARIAAKASETLGQEAADYGRKAFEHATAAFKSFATVKSPTELFQLQSEFAKASFDNAVAEASKLSETMVKLAGEIAQPLSNRYALAAEKIKATVA